MIDGYIYLCETCNNEYGVIPGVSIRCPNCRSKERVGRDIPHPKIFCKWQADDDGCWDTECGECFVFEDGGPKENKSRFCQYCGGRILIQNDQAQAPADAETKHC